MPKPFVLAQGLRQGCDKHPLLPTGYDSVPGGLSGLLSGCLFCNHLSHAFIDDVPLIFTMMTSWQKLALSGALGS